MSDASRSRRMMGSAASASDEESRAFLQGRVAKLFELMFWSLLALLGFLAALYTVYPADAPDARAWVYLHAAVGLAAMGFIWRVLLVRRTLSMSALYRLDLAYSLGIGVSFGVAAWLQQDLRASGYLSVVYLSFTVFARALIVPSSGPRTAVASTITFAPMTLAAVALAVGTEQDVPPLIYFFACNAFCAASIVLATFGSNTIYGLRREATVAEQLGQYKLDRKIGEGGMGEVYLAHHVLLRRPTAIKRVLPDRIGRNQLERFEREVQAMSQLTHPNTVAVYDYGHSGGIFYYAMEYLGGGIDLEKLVRKHGMQPSGRVVHILSQICGALHEAHSKQIIHRDIKPANIILCHRGGVPDVAKVVDYGLVKEFSANTGVSTQFVLGTPSYLAPEALTDPLAVGPAADLYALGAVGYFLLTGRRVFDGKTSIEICVQHVTAVPTPPSAHVANVQPELEAVLMRCLAKQPAARYANAVELRDALRSVPRDPEWNVATANRWWVDFRSVEDAEPSPTSLPTITIDLEERA